MVTELGRMRALPKVHMPKVVLDGYLQPPESPQQCTFAQLTTCISADLATALPRASSAGGPFAPSVAVSLRQAWLPLEDTGWRA